MLECSLETARKSKFSFLQLTFQELEKKMLDAVEVFT